MQLLPSFHRFREYAEQGRVVPVWREFLFDVDTAVTAYAKLARPPLPGKNVSVLMSWS